MRSSVPPASEGGTWVIDLDGVVWLAGEPIPGSGDAVRRLRDAGAGVIFASNNSSPTIPELLARLERAGITATPDEVITSAQAAASMIAPGLKAFVVADAGVVEALDDRGVTVVGDDDGEADVVVVGWTQRFDFDLLAAANRVVRAGARLIGTNEDPTHPTPGGLLPGSGALLAAVATASGRVPEVAGKPHRPLAQLIAGRVGRVAAVVGDRPSTDGVLARYLDAPFALVLTGVTPPHAVPSDPAPDLVAKDLAAVVDEVTG